MTIPTTRPKMPNIRGRSLKTTEKTLSLFERLLDPNGHTEIKNGPNVTKVLKF